jgi:hypothetical protein
MARDENAEEPEPTGYEQFAKMGLALPEEAVVTRHFIGVVLDNSPNSTRFRITTDDLIGTLIGAIGALEMRIIELEKRPQA